MKQLKFEHSYISQIVSGEKTATVRINDDKNIHPGDVIEVIDKVDRNDPKTWQLIGAVTVVRVEKGSLRQVAEQYSDISESFDNFDEMVQVFRRFYGDFVDAETVVSVIVFEYHSYSEAKPFIDDRKDGMVEASQFLSVLLHADGGSRGNPGPSAAGFVVMDETDTRVLTRVGKYLGITTNNQAEYHACLLGMRWCLEHGVRDVKVYLDSMLVVNQMKGTYKVKNRDLWSLYEETVAVAKKFRTVSFTHVPRELNKPADHEVNKILDAVRGTDVVQ